MTMDEYLKEVKEREQGAMKGPWRYDGLDCFNEDGEWDQVIDISPDDLITLPTGKFEHKEAELNTGCRKNAEFIAHSRQDIPTLLAIIGVYRGAIEKVAREPMPITRTYMSMISRRALQRAEELVP